MLTEPYDQYGSCDRCPFKLDCIEFTGAYPYTSIMLDGMCPEPEIILSWKVSADIIIDVDFSYKEAEYDFEFPTEVSEEVEYVP